MVIPREELFTLAVSLTTLETDLNLFTIFTNSKPHSKMLCILIGGSGGLVSRNKKKIGGLKVFHTVTLCTYCILTMDG